MGLPNSTWRLSELNRDYSLIPSYPAILCVPERFDDNFLRRVSKFRTRCRIPVLSWIHPTNGAVLVRCSQPRRGVTNSTNAYDEEYLEFLSTQGINPGRLWVYDARSETAAIGNKAIGGGVEEGYKNTKVVFCDVENIHAVRGSWKTLIKLCSETNGDDLIWYNKLQECVAALRVVSSLMGGESVLVHCSDGWDRTAQMTSIATLLMDPYYRSFNGFQLLIEKEWLSFGHQMALRNGIETMAGSTSSEESPIFLQFIECVAYLRSVYPTAFEFNEDFLVALFDNLYSCAFGTFMCNSERERLEKQIATSTVSFWLYIDQHREHYTNLWYSQVNETLCPNVGAGHLQIWRRLWYRWDPIEVKARSQKDKRMRSIKDEFKQLGGNLSDLVKSNTSNVAQTKFSSKYVQPNHQDSSLPSPESRTWSPTNPFLKSDHHVEQPEFDSGVPASARNTIDDDDPALPDFDGDAVEMDLIAKNLQTVAKTPLPPEPASSVAEIAQENSVFIDRIRKRKITQCQKKGSTTEDIDMTDAAELLEARGGLKGSSSSSSDNADLAVSYSGSSSDEQYIKFTGDDTFFKFQDESPSTAPPPRKLELPKEATVRREFVPRHWPPRERGSQDGDSNEPSSAGRAWPPSPPAPEARRGTHESDVSANSTLRSSGVNPNRAAINLNTPPVPPIWTGPVPDGIPEAIRGTPSPGRILESSPTSSPRKPQPTPPPKKTPIPPNTQAAKALPLPPTPLTPTTPKWQMPPDVSPTLQNILSQIGPPPTEPVPRPTKR